MVVEDAIMEILVWKAFEMVRDRLGKLAAATRKLKSNRRASRQDRRRSVNDGVIVTLSTRQERRHSTDRRHREATWQQFAL